MKNTQPQERKPAMLQANVSGGWRNVCRIDCADEVAADAALEAAEKLALASIDQVKLRICIDQAHPSDPPLMTWNEKAGWKP